MLKVKFITIQVQVLLKMLVKIIKCLYNFYINTGSNNFNNSICTYNIENKIMHKVKI